MLRQGIFLFRGWVIAFGASVVLSLVGCGEKGTSNPSIEADYTKYIAQSCAFGPDEGGKVEAVRSANSIAVGYFGKPYNQDWFRSVLRSSLRETVEYIETTGTRVYRAESISSKTCKNLSFPEAMPAQIANAWGTAIRNAAEENRAAKTVGFVTGLYLFKERFSEKGSPSEPGVIIVREDANRWTLLHEFLHHNFKVQAVSAGYRDEEHQEARRRLPHEMSAILQRSDLSEAEKVRILTPLFVSYVRIADRLFLEYYLEEIAVEALLQDAYDEGELRYVPALSYENASWYTEQSREKMKTAFAALESFYTMLRDGAERGNLDAEKRELEAFVRIKDRRLSQFEGLQTSRAAARERRDSFKLGSFTAAPGAKGVNAESLRMGSPCAEGRIAERSVDEMGREIRALMRL
jgi:hypothetical protein